MRDDTAGNVWEVVTATTHEPRITATAAETRRSFRVIGPPEAYLSSLILYVFVVAELARA